MKFDYLVSTSRLLFRFVLEVRNYVREEINTKKYETAIQLLFLDQHFLIIIGGLSSHLLICLFLLRKKKNVV